MQKWEFLILIIRYGESDQVKSVRRNGKKIFSEETLEIALSYMDDLKNEGWEPAKVTEQHWGEIREFERHRE